MNAAQTLLMRFCGGGWAIAPRAPSDVGTSDGGGGDEAGGDEFELTDDLLDQPEPEGEEEGEEEEIDDETGEAKAKPGKDAAAAAGDPKPTPEEIERRLQSTQRALRKARADIKAIRETPAREQQQQRRAAEPEAAIDPDVDPIGALKQMRSTIKAYQDAEARNAADADAAQRQERQYRVIETALGEQEADLRLVHPDYDAAARHYVNSRMAEMKEFGVAPQDIPKMMRQELVTLTAQSLKANRDGAEAIYKLAKARGYKLADPPAKDGKGDKAAGGKAASTLDRLRGGQRASSPLSRGGSGRNGEIDPKVVANINIRSREGGEAFDKMWERMEAQAKDADRKRR